MSPRVSRWILAVVSVVGVAVVLVLPHREQVGAVILGAIGVISALFSGLYGWRSNWRATAAGRIIMRLMLSVTAIGAHGTVNAFTDAGYPGRDFVRPLLLLAIVITVLQLLMRLVWMQRHSDGGVL